MYDPETEAAFLESIRDDPDDDAPRLVYSDWLDEQGDSERAEFIRLQIRLETLDPDDPDFRPMRDRAQELRQANHVEWVNRLPQLEGVHWEIFERGFISAVRFNDPDAFFHHAAAAFRAAPIQEVRLHRFEAHDAHRLGDSRHLERIRVIDLNDGNRIGNQGAEGLMRSRYLGKLRVLKVGRNALGPAAVQAIAHASYARGLQELKLERNDLYDDALRFLASSPAMAQLQKLDLDRTRTGDEGLRSLSATKHLKKLVSLNLSNNQITAEGLAALVSSEVVRGLVSLFLQNNSLGSRGAEAIARSSRLESLEFLFLRQNGIGDEGALALARSAHLPRLRYLYLGENRISDQAAAVLRNALGQGINVF